jgi:UDP-N-acetylmuramoyl-L-alanyl-D-glutamate--2,6-diaminopimelate ligase
MWSIVDQMSDVVILTEDDSMTEPIQQIIKEVAKWIQRQEWNNYYIIPHRKDAVRFATEIAQAWDIVLLAWKWHETALYTNFGKIEYHEKTFLEEVLSS